MKASIRGGKCLSTYYGGVHKKLKWVCKKWHIWKSTLASIMHGETWCSKCEGLAKLTIQDMQILALSRNGKCLSNRYINYRTKLRWQCEYGHVWLSAPYSVKGKNRWCPKCGKKQAWLKRRRKKKDEKNVS